MTTSSFKLQQTVLAIALAAAYPLQAYAAPSAGVAQFTSGDVNVRRPDGNISPLIKGNDLESGQSILTGATGRAQVRFSDGGLISLQPNTEFKIAKYSDNAANPKEERFLVDLLRGSMRAITGLIGKRNHDNYKVTTNTATIGIRGSGFNVGYNPDGSLGVTTELDAIEVCNGGGCVGLTAGESVRVVNSTDAPVRTNVRASVPTPETQQDPVIVGNKVNDEGKAMIVAGSGQTAGDNAAGTANSGTFTNLTAAVHYYLPPLTSDPNGSFVGPVSSASTVLVGGNPTEIEASGYVFKPVSTATSGYFGSTANGDYIGWGNWTSATKNGATNLSELHYIVGQATPVLPTTIGAATYSFAGGSVTSYTGSSGTISNSSSMSVNFDPAQSGGPMMAVNIVTSFGNVTDNSLYFSSSSFANVAGTIKGIFTGTNANRAGLIYTGPSSPGSFSGTAVFQAP